MSRDLPLWQSHKQVRAAKITNIYPLDGNFILDFGDHTVTVTQVWYERHNPEIGGYFVRYEDGYESYSPAEPFESGYTAIMDEKLTLIRMAVLTSMFAANQVSTVYAHDAEDVLIPSTLPRHVVPASIEELKAGQLPLTIMLKDDEAVINGQTRVAVVEREHAIFAQNGHKTLIFGLHVQNLGSYCAVVLTLPSIYAVQMGDGEMLSIADFWQRYSDPK